MRLKVATDSVEFGSNINDVVVPEAMRNKFVSGLDFFDAAIGGARRDEEKSRAKERVFSHRAPGHVWEPRGQRPEFRHHTRHHGPLALPSGQR